MTNETIWILYSIVSTAVCAFIGLTVFRYRFGTTKKFNEQREPLNKRPSILLYVITSIIIGIIINFLLLKNYNAPDYKYKYGEIVTLRLPLNMALATQVVIIDDCFKKNNHNFYKVRNIKNKILTVAEECLTHDEPQQNSNGGYNSE